MAIYLGLHPDIRPADYLARLRAEGLTGVDALPAERTALDYAALLPPDSIPWPWLRALVEQEHPDALTKRQGYDDPWQTLRRRLGGLRLLTPGDHVEIARLHRMVAAHVRARLAASGAAGVEGQPRAAGVGSEGQRPGHMPAQGNALGGTKPGCYAPSGLGGSGRLGSWGAAPGWHGTPRWG